MQSTSRSAAITAELRAEILRGQYRSGERLPSERDLAERFGVHRGAVREALKRLEQLGLAHIRPGGARVAPIEEASLDVVKHLLDLENPPDPLLVDQVLEAMSGLFTMSARLCAERATDEQRAGIGEVLDRLSDRDLPLDERVAMIDELGDRFVEAADNLVLKIVRRGVQAPFIEDLRSRGVNMHDPDWVEPELLKAVRDAIDARDGIAASESVYALTRRVRQRLMETINAAREPEATARSKP